MNNEYLLQGKEENGWTGSNSLKAQMYYAHFRRVAAITFLGNLPLSYGYESLSFNRIIT